MPRRPNNVPIYRRHKPTNQAVCTVRLANGKAKVVYLGTWKSAASRAEYGRVVSLVSTNGGIYPSAADDLTVNEANSVGGSDGRRDGRGLGPHRPGR